MPDVSRSCCLVFASILAVSVADSFAADDGNSRVDFTRDIKPIVSNLCYRCHGPDAAERKGGNDGLRLDTAEGLYSTFDDRTIIAPGKPEISEFVRRISTADEDEVMPPKGAGRRLTAHEIDIIKRWIKQGAPISRHWSYVKPMRPQLPSVSNESWIKTPVDRFILSRLDREGLKPSPEADRETLIRRLALDLIGLPPTLAEVDEFQRDTRPNAYELLVDRLLAKPAYGEHWGLLWLDQARYADSAGYADDPIRTIWLYRDYVIKAFNQNMPFDQFTVEQIAGDLLPNPTDDQLVATAFHRNTMTNSEGGTNDEEFRNVAVVDRVNTTMAVWMGTTMACAQCHSHKYDPITQEEYFKFFAIFNNTGDADRPDESPLHSIWSDEQKQKRSSYEEQIAKLENALKTVTPELTAAQTKWDADFPRAITWAPLKPNAVSSDAKSATTIAEDGSVSVAAGATKDTYQVNIGGSIRLPLRGLRMDVLPDDNLPGKGPGHAGGNFVITKVSAKVNPPAGTSLSGRYVRVELPGADKYLSLAEVQVFSGSENIAPKGEATQISTDFGGDAKRAIDGNTDGNYNATNSTSHTAAGKDPWWEVDLKSEHPVNKIALWNRTDGAGERLANFRVLVLNEKRETVWRTDVAASPSPSAELPIDGSRTIEFDRAFADFSQPDYDASNVLKGKEAKAKGWAIGGATGVAHSLTLTTKSAVEIPEGSTISVTIEQTSDSANHTLGHFRLLATDDQNVAEWARTPAAVVDFLKTPASERTAEQKEKITQHYLSIAPQLDETRQQLAAAKKSLREVKPDTVPVMKELAENRRKTRIQFRGNFEDLGPEVGEGTPEIFGSLPKDAIANRLTLAKWLVDKNNPLTARVMANRYWEQLFGIGIVASSEEFGSQGDLPFHPELLDWLACELSGIPGEGTAAAEPSIRPWDLKAFIKLLVMSSAYRQSSKVSPELIQRDPENRLLARGPRFRLSAEALRDQALYVSGLLSPKMFGPPVKPPQPSLGLSAAFGSSTDWKTSSGEDKFRRGIYTTWRRSNPYPSMATFDAPNREVCTLRRVRTNTPLQALVTMNDPVYIEAAQALARRILAEGGQTNTERANYAVKRVLSRVATPAEQERLVQLYERSLERISKNSDEATKLATDPLGPAEPGMSVEQLAAWTVVGNVLLNLDEFVMKR